jgi:hypothetical protein
MEMEVVHHLDAVSGAIADNHRVPQVSVAGAQDINSAQKSGLYDRVIVRIGGDDPVGRGGNSLW